MIALWAESAMRRIFPDAAPGPIRLVDLAGARNERLDFQIGILADLPVRSATVNCSDLRGPRGARIAHSRIRWNFEAYLFLHANTRTTAASELERPAPGLFPDGLMEEREIDLKPGLCQPAWVTVTVPVDAPCGEYSGRIEVRAAGVRRSLPLRLTVWPFALPESRSLHMTNWFWPRALCAHYGVPLFKGRFWELLDDVARNMADHRQNVILTPMTNLVRSIHTRDGWRFDFRDFDRWVGTFDRHGAADLIELEHLGCRTGDWESPFGYARMQVFDTQGRPETLPPVPLGDPEREAYLRDYLAALGCHLKQKGWFHRTIIHQADEPVAANRASYERLSRFVSATLPGMRRIDAVVDAVAADSLEIRVPLLPAIDNTPRPIGQTTWFYTCLVPRGPFPNRFVDFPLIKTRIIHWLNWSRGATGYLHWGYNWWFKWQRKRVALDPWRDAAGASHELAASASRLPPGDPFVVYPGRNGICNSIRWETVRRGVEDYEYLKLLERRAEREPARSDLRRRIMYFLGGLKTGPLRDLKNYPRDPMVLENARQAAAELLCGYEFRSR